MNKEVVSVVAGGWSFSQVPQELVPGYVIAVNDAAFHLRKRPDEIVSMDRQWSEHRIWEIIAFQIPTYLRREAVQNLHDKIHGRPWINVFDCDHESYNMALFNHNPPVREYGDVYAMTDHPYTLNGTNSGMCGVNRAYKVATRAVYLFGFDMQFGPNGEKHWYPDYDWPYQPKAGKLREWAPQFAAIAKQFMDRRVQLFNVNNRSLIKGTSTMWLETLKRMNEIEHKIKIGELAP